MTTVFFDIDTQLDFLLPAGSLYVPGAGRLIPALTRLNQFAASRGMVVVSSMCSHSENDAEFRDWPAHCVTGTVGQQKPASTMLTKRLVVPTAPGNYAIEGVEQILLEKQQLDLFTNPNLSQLLSRLAADRYVVYGVVTEYCVRIAAMGLLATRKPVSLVTDAIATLRAQDSARTLQEVTSAGGELVTVAEVCSR